MPSAVASSSRRSLESADKTGREMPPGEVALQIDRERDARWVTRALEGEADAFRLLVEHYQERAFRIAHGVMGNREEAWDVAQEAFLRVYRSLHRFQLGQSFYTWLYRIVVNLSIDTLRKRAQDRLVALDELGDSVGVECPPGSDLDQQELRQRVQDVLNLLPPKYKVALVLRDIEELSCWEIAQVVRCTHATARWRLHKARKMFKETWERYVRRSRTSRHEWDEGHEGSRSRPPFG